MKWTSLAAVAAFWPVSGLADPAPPNSEAGPYVADAVRVGELVVTRLPADQDETPASTLIRREEIEIRQAVFATDLLRLVPGVAIASNGAYGGITSVLIRGASSDKTLVLVDGVIQNDPSQPAGGYDFAALQVGSIEKVEVLRGPQAALWGSDAIGGVIAFSSRREDGARASLEGGTYGAFRGDAGIGYVGETWSVSASADGFRTNGISKADGFPERDGFWAWRVSGAGSASPADWLTLDGRVTYERSRAEVDGYAPPFFAFGDTDDWSASHAWNAFARARFVGPWDLQQTLLISLYDLSRNSSGIGYGARRWDYRWLMEKGHVFDTVSFALGAERDDTRASLSTGERESLGATSVFGLVRWRPLARLLLSGSLRYDDPDGFDGRASAKVGAVLQLGGGVSVLGDWGQGFKTPTISETACDFCFPPGPSTGLRPETAEGWDAGVRVDLQDGRLVAEVLAFELSVDDQISYGIGRYVNLNHTRARGVEATLYARLTDALSFKAAYTHTHSEDVATGDPLLRVTPDAGSASLLWSVGRLRGALTVRGEGARLDVDPSIFSPARRPGFVVADLAAAWRLTDWLEITGRVENLAGRHYQQSLGYGEPGRVFMVGLRASQ